MNTLIATPYKDHAHIHITNDLHQKSLLHAILDAMDTKEVNQMNDTCKNKLVHKIRLNISKHITFDSWVNNSHCIGYFIDKYKSVFENHYSYLSGNIYIHTSHIKHILSFLSTNGLTLDNVYTFVPELFPFDLLCSTIQGQTHPTINQCIETLLSKVKTHITSLGILDNVESSKREFIISSVNTCMCVISKEISNEIYNEFVHDIACKRIQMNTYSIDYISKWFHKNIYILYDDNRIVCNNNQYDTHSVILKYDKDTEFYDIIGYKTDGSIQYMLNTDTKEICMSFMNSGGE